jgi:hypothetical protein
MSQIAALVLKRKRNQRAQEDLVSNFHQPSLTLVLPYQPFEPLAWRESRPFSLEPLAWVNH